MLFRMFVTPIGEKLARRLGLLEGEGEMDEKSDIYQQAVYNKGM